MVKVSRRLPWEERISGSKGIVSPFGLRDRPPEARQVLGKASPLPEKGLQRLRFSGSIRSARTLIIPPLAGDRPALKAGFVFLVLTPWLIESARLAAPPCTA